MEEHTGPCLESLKAECLPLSGIPLEKLWGNQEMCPKMLSAALFRIIKTNNRPNTINTRKLICTQNTREFYTVMKTQLHSSQLLKVRDKGTDQKPKAETDRTMVSLPNTIQDSDFPLVGMGWVHVVEANSLRVPQARGGFLALPSP